LDAAGEVGLGLGVAGEQADHLLAHFLVAGALLG